MPGPQWPELEIIDTRMPQITEGHGLKQGSEVVLRTRLASVNNLTRCSKSSPGVWSMRKVELGIHYGDQESGG